MTETKLFFFQIFLEILSEMQSELSQKRRQSPRHEEVPGRGFPQSQRRGQFAVSLRQHVRSQQLEARKTSQTHRPN